jgi:hypothetical protein
VLSVRRSLLCCLVSACALCGWAMFGAAITPALAVSLPSVSEESLVKIGSAGATLSAQINPGSAEASYSVQYGTTGAYGSETAPVTISPVTQTVSAALANLQSDTEYHARFVAVNEQGSEHGVGLTFTTYPSGVSSGLPDGRVWELVTPAENENAEVDELDEGLLYTGFPFQAAANGDAVAYIEQPAKGGNGSAEHGLGDQHVAVRGPQGGWTQTNVTPQGSNEYGHYEGFSSELSSGVLLTYADAPFTPTSTLHEVSKNPNEYNGLFSTRFGETPFYRPLFDGEPPHRIDNPLTEQKGERSLGSDGLFGTVYSGEKVLYAGSSANSEDLLFEANDQLLGGEGPAVLETELGAIVDKELEGRAEEIKLREEEEEKGSNNFHSLEERVAAVELFDNRDELYESHEGHLSLVNVLPGSGKVAPGATFGGQGIEVLEESAFEANFSHDISSDGSRIFWTWPETSIVEPQSYKKLELGPGSVYVRENGTSTVQVSQGLARFWTASPDGADAFYTEAGKLWRFDVEDEARVELAGAAGGVVAVLGTNETGPDGSYVYFVSTEALPGDNRAGQSPVAGQDNLYVYEPDTETGGSRVAFISTLGGGEANDWAASMGARLSSITPDGHALTFTARENLTGKPYPDEGEEEVYVYDANEGSLICASCRAQASGGHFPTSGSHVYTYRRIGEDGNEVFFDSAAPLVASDVNGVQDVYEWERDGSGECKETDGCVYLLSGGVEGDAFLVDTSVSGGDVFFVARQKLVAEDGTEDAVLYDARVGGALQVSPPECTGTGCQGVPSPPPLFATPASVTFEGVGNFAPAAASKVKPAPKAKVCGKDYARKNGRCIKKKSGKKRKASVKAGRVSVHGGRSR